MCPHKVDRFERECFVVLCLVCKSAAKKAAQFTDAQKAFFTKQGEEAMPVAEVCRKAGISLAIYFACKKKYSGRMPSEMRWLKWLDDWDGRLKRIVGNLLLDMEMLLAVAPDNSSI